MDTVPSPMSPASVNAVIRRNPRDNSSTRTRTRHTSATAAAGSSPSQVYTANPQQLHSSPQRVAVHLKSPNHRSSPAPPDEQPSFTLQDKPQSTFQAFFDKEDDLIGNNTESVSSRPMSRESNHSTFNISEAKEDTFTGGSAMMQSTFQPFSWEDESRLLDRMHETSDGGIQMGDCSRQSPTEEHIHTSTSRATVLRTASFASEVKSDSHNSIPSDAHYYPPEDTHSNNNPMVFLPDTLDSQEQALFEQRLCHDPYGIAVRKINSNGKSQLRYVKCETIAASGFPQNGDYSNKKSSSKMLNMSKSLPVTLNSSHLHGGAPLAKKISTNTTSTTTTTTHMNDTASGTSFNCIVAMGSPYRGGGGGGGGESSSSIPDKMDIPTSTSTTIMESTGQVVTHRPRADSTTSSATTSGTSHPGSQPRPDSKKFNMDESLLDTGNIRVLAWGNKKKLKIPLSKFIAVHKGKTTDRTKKNTCPPSRLLSLISNDPILGSLDIEAPTRLDRDKFAAAFSQFLRVPLVEEDMVKNGTMADTTTVGVKSTTLSAHSVVSAPIVNDRKPAPSVVTSMGYSVPDAGALKIDSRRKNPSLTVQMVEKNASISVGAVLKTGNPTIAENIKRLDDTHKLDDKQITDVRPQAEKEKGGVVLDWKSSDIKPGPSKTKQDHDAASQVSSLTQVIDEEIIEELHQTITELRAELEASRAEAARAVKVAEQAIQSAESCSSNDWNSTVTHKAAEAAAQAQKRSAEAMARQRKAEENLAEERKNAAYWRKQADLAEGEVNKLRIRVAAAEVQRFNVSTTLQDMKSNADLMVELVKREAEKSEEIIKGKLQVFEEKNRALEALIEKSKRIVKRKDDEIKKLQAALNDAKSAGKINIFNRGGAKKANETTHDSPPIRKIGEEEMKNDAAVANYSNMQSEIFALRSQLRSLRRAALDEFKQLPKVADDCLHQVGDFMKKAITESVLLKEKLALEASCRRKLLHELQDLRGNIRTYCRPMLKSGNDSSCILSSPADDICVLNGEFPTSDSSENDISNPMRFEFDKVFSFGSSQSEVYSELEGTIIDVLNGFNVCMMSHGPSGTGKTFTIIGDVDVDISDTSTSCEIRISNVGVALLAVQQLFQVAQHRSDTFKDTFTLSLIEVHNEKLVDLIGSASLTAEGSGKSFPQKLEIKTNHDGDTIVQGAVHIALSSHTDFTTAWTDAIKSRIKRLQDEGIDRKAYEASCHTIATVQVVSRNITNGSGTTGKIHFVDLAASDAVIRRNSMPTKPRTHKALDILAPVGNSQEWKFMNKSISVLADVAVSRAQFSRTVPYRNSTITHLLRDSLEADTKVILLLCVGCDAENLQDTANALRFASVMRNIVVGKATKHLVT